MTDDVERTIVDPSSLSFAGVSRHIDYTERRIDVVLTFVVDVPRLETIDIEVVV